MPSAGRPAVFSPRHERTTGPRSGSRPAGPRHPLRRRHRNRRHDHRRRAGTSRRRTRRSRSSAPTPRARCSRAAPVGRTWSRASARTSGRRPSTRRSSTASIKVSDAESFAAARRVTREEGLLIGGSCGTGGACRARRRCGARPRRTSSSCCCPTRARLPLEDLQRRVDDALRLPPRRRPDRGRRARGEARDAPPPIPDLVLITPDEPARDAVRARCATSACRSSS